MLSMTMTDASLGANKLLGILGILPTGQIKERITLKPTEDDYGLLAGILTMV